MTEPMFAVEGVGKRFGRRVILTTAGAWAVPNRITVLLGRNGTGKSTLIKIATGQLRADRGVVIYKGDRTVRPRLEQLARRGLYYLPERGVLSRWFRVRTHLDAVRRLSSGRYLHEAVDLCGLHDILDRPASQLSGGERRRAEFGLVVARRPECLVADEPFQDLSPKACAALSDVLRHLASHGCAVLITGHEVDVLLDVADDVIWMTAGTTHALGTPDAARRHDQFRREYLGAHLTGRRFRDP